jgi:hypothetical protein
MSNYPPVRIVSPARFHTATAQTPGSQRRAAVASNSRIKSALWGGLFMVEPGSKTGIHHHGEQETIAYVLKGDPYLSGGRPLYADYILFGCFMWARSISGFRLLTSDDPIYAWRERMLDAMGGLVRNAPHID